MSRPFRTALPVLTLSLAIFAAGGVLACSGNYCGSLDTTDCVSLDIFLNESCCKDLGSGLRCWNCNREAFQCIVEGEIVPKLGPGFDCEDPGPSCQ